MDRYAAAWNEGLTSPLMHAEVEGPAETVQKHWRVSRSRNEVKPDAEAKRAFDKAGEQVKENLERTRWLVFLQQSDAMVHAFLLDDAVPSEGRVVQVWALSAIIQV